MTTSTQNHSEVPPRAHGRLRNMALFLASPFIGLYYAMLMPGKLIQLAKAEYQAQPAAQKPPSQ